VTISVTSADVRLSVGPNLSCATCQRPVDLASPRRGLWSTRTQLAAYVRFARQSPRGRFFTTQRKSARYPVSTKLNNSQNEGAESATLITLYTPTQARILYLQLLLNTHAATQNPLHTKVRISGLLCVGLRGLGQSDQALSRLERACDEHSGHVVFLKVKAEWDPLRQGPRFADLMQHIGL